MNKIGHVLIAQAELWVHGGTLHHLPYFWNYYKMSMIIIVKISDIVILHVVSAKLVKTPFSVI